MSENESKLWWDEALGDWDAEGSNDAVTILICENIEELLRQVADLVDSPLVVNTSTIAATLWMLRNFYSLVCCNKPYHLFAFGLFWGMMVQRWADEKGIDLEKL